METTVIPRYGLLRQKLAINLEAYLVGVGGGWLIESANNGSRMACSCVLNDINGYRNRETSPHPKDKPAI